MSNVNHMNEAPILGQIAGQYEKLLLLVLMKYKPHGVVITATDIEASMKKDVVLFVHGHRDSIEFKAVTTAEAKRLAEHHDATHKGRA